MPPGMQYCEVPDTVPEDVKRHGERRWAAIDPDPYYMRGRYVGAGPQFLAGLAEPIKAQPGTGRFVTTPFGGEGHTSTYGGWPEPIAPAPASLGKLPLNKRDMEMQDNPDHDLILMAKLAGLF